MINIVQLCLLVNFLLLTSWVDASSVFFQVDGLPEILEKKVHAKLSSFIQNEKIISNKCLCARIENVIRNTLKVFGYYEPTISFNLCSSSRQTINSRKMPTIYVSAGIPIRISGTNVVLRGEACTDEDYLNLLNSRPSIGTVLNHSDFLNFKKSLSDIALRKGYFDNQLNKSHLLISLTGHKAFWDIDYDSGQRYHFGSVIFKKSQIRDEYLRNLVPFKKGDPFNSEKLSELIYRLSTIGWFNSIIISPDFKKSHNKILNFQGILSPYTKNSVEIDVGYSTNFGPRTRGSWEKPWINSYGHSLKTDASISLPEQKFNFSYKIPISRNPFEQYYLVQGKAKLVNPNDFSNNSSTAFIISRYWDLSNDSRRAISLRLSRDHSKQTDITNTSTLFCVGITFNRNRSYDELMPSWINYKHYSLEYSTNGAWNSDINFIVAQVKNAWIRTLYDQHRFIIRENFGWIEARNLEKVPSNFRFFAGGDHSIRGYRYKSISLKNKDRELIGASRLITGSIEYQYKVDKKWWSAIFVDGGEAVSNIRCSDFKTGIGVGIRWESPIGPMKVDFAIPIGDKEEHNPQFYIGLEPEL